MRLVRLAPDQLDLYREHFRIDFANHTAGKHQSRRPAAGQTGSFPERSGTVFEPLTAVERASGEKPVLISGFRRFYATSNNVNSRFQVFLIKPRTVLNAVKESVLIKSSGNLISDWEKAAWIIALNKVSPVFHSALETAGLLGRAARALQVPVSNLVPLCPIMTEHNNRSALISAASLPLPFLHRCQGCGVDVIKASLLAHYDSQERPLATILTCLVKSLSVSHMRRFEQLARDIALRNHTSVLKILISIRNVIRRNPEINWLEYMQKIRSPERAKMEGKVSDLMGTLMKNPSTALNIPEDYEGDSIDVTFRISSPDDLKRAADILLTRSEEWIRLLNLIQKGLDENV